MVANKLPQSYDVVGALQKAQKSGTLDTGCYTTSGNTITYNNCNYIRLGLQLHHQRLADVHAHVPHLERHGETDRSPPPAPTRELGHRRELDRESDVHLDEHGHRH